MLDVQTYIDGVAQAADDYADALAAATAGNGVVWADLLLDDDEALTEVAAALRWHEVIPATLRQAHKRAKLEHTKSATVLVLLPARYLDEPEEVELSSLAIVIGPASVVTLRGADWIDVGAAREFLAAHPIAAGAGPYGITWGICETVLTSSAPVIEGVEEDIDEIEEQLFAADATDVSRRIFALQRELVRLQHASSPVPEMLDALGDSLPTEAALLRSAYRSASDHAEHAHGRVVGFRQTLDNALSVHATLVGEQSNAEMAKMTEFSIRQNDQVKKISSWAAIGFAPSLIAGIYGMNFHTMPELAFPWGYPAALLLMLGVGAALYGVFKRHDWL
ncbi:CorA family divalent cation transporter [Microbacterium sp. ZW T5_56]|uniref:CorA family divalent cation transporter n=1 Tax=Microbacterium sp. ZW T5_56 TaxID=3378081 RepID=UPI0038525D2B